jgi:hypothetical protein
VIRAKKGSTRPPKWCPGQKAGHTNHQDINRPCLIERELLLLTPPPLLVSIPEKEKGTNGAVTTFILYYKPLDMRDLDRVPLLFPLPRMRVEQPPQLTLQVYSLAGNSASVAALHLLYLFWGSAAAGGCLLETGWMVVHKYLTMASY